MNGEDTNSNSHVLSVGYIENAQDIGGSAEKQQDLSRKTTEEIEEHIAEAKIACNGFEEKKTIQETDEMQEAPFMKEVLPSQAFQREDPKNNEDNGPFTSGISNEEIPGQEHTEDMLSRTNVCEQMKHFLTEVKQTLDYQKKDFLKDTPEISNKNHTTKTDFKISSNVFKEGYIMNDELTENIQEHIQVMATEADTNFRKILGMEFSISDNKSYDEEETKISKAEFSKNDQESSEKGKENTMLKVEFLKNSEIEKVLKDQEFSKKEEDDETLKEEFPKNDQELSKEGKDDTMLMIEFLKNLEIEKIFKDQEFSKKEEDDETLKEEFPKNDQKSLKAEFLEDNQELSKEKKEKREVLKAESSKDDQEISKEKGQKMLQTKFQKDNREPSKKDDWKNPENMRLQIQKDVEKAQELINKAVSNVNFREDISEFIKEIKQDFKGEYQKFLKGDHSKNVDIALLKIPSVYPENYTITDETSDEDLSKKPLQIGDSRDDQGSLNVDHPKDIQDVILKVPEESLSGDQRLRKESEKQIQNNATENEKSIDEMLEIESSKPNKKSMKNEKEDEKLKTESLKNDQKLSRRAKKNKMLKAKSSKNDQKSSKAEEGEERMLKTESLENNKKSLKKDDQKDFEDIKSEIHNEIENPESYMKMTLPISNDTTKVTTVKQIIETQNAEYAKDDRKSSKGNYPENVDIELKIPNKISAEDLMEDQMEFQDENHFNKPLEMENPKYSQESLNIDRPKKINDTKSLNLEGTSKTTSAKNSAKNTKKSVKEKDTAQKISEKTEETNNMQKTIDLKDSQDISNDDANISSLALPKSSLHECCFVLAIYLVPSLPIELFEILAEIIEEIIKRPVVLIYESRNNKIPCEKIVDMAILPADTKWKDGVLLNASFVFEHHLNQNNSPHVYVNVIVSSNLPSYIKDILHLRGHGCIVPNKRNKLSAGGLLYDFLRMRGEGPSFFGHTTVASSQLAVLEAVVKQHIKLGVIDGPVMNCHKFNCSDVAPIHVLHSLGPLPPYRIMFNKHMEDHEIMMPIATYLLNIHKNKKWMTKLSRYGITGFAENFVDYYSLDNMESVTTNVPYY